MTVYVKEVGKGASKSQDQKVNYLYTMPIPVFKGISAQLPQLVLSPAMASDADNLFYYFLITLLSIKNMQIYLVCKNCIPKFI